MPRYDVIAQLVRRIEELERRASNQHREGTISDVDYQKGLVKVSDGVWTSGWLQWQEHSSNGGVKTRTMPKKGAGAVVKAVSGLLENGTVTFGCYPTQTNQMPSADNGEHVWQMGADDPSQGKQVKTVTDDQGNHSISATDSHTKTVGDYSHTMTKDGGHVFKAGDSITYTMTKDGGHQFKAGDHFSYTIHPTDGHTLSANGQTLQLTNAGALINALTAFSKNYGVGYAPGAINRIDDATPGFGA